MGAQKIKNAQMQIAFSIFHLKLWEAIAKQSNRQDNHAHNI
jgi:hypothetical protein